MKDMCSEYINNSPNSITRENPDLKKNGQKNLNICFTKEDLWMASMHKKNLIRYMQMNLYTC